MEYESGYEPTSVGDSGSSYGLCQWHNERYSAMLGYCGANGLDGNSISGQMAFLSNELSNRYPNVMNYLYFVPDSAQDAYDSAYYKKKARKPTASAVWMKAPYSISYMKNIHKKENFTY